ncbi:DUF3179 domain-containing (seleno)protein [Ekhidna sp.]|uniref:DUF3179 domain-containing (seleno)protein n=1 Tax=Ekhidna sp. TaxID=2608089 RepID=UPI003297E85E
MKYSLLILSFFIFASCTSNVSQQASDKESEESQKRQRPVSVDNGKIFQVDNRKMLYGGPDSSQHFDITNNELKDEQFHYGIGREAFSALLNPEFITISEADSQWHDTTRFLVAYRGDEVKAYSVPDLTRHEVVNDSLDGKPIMAAYCILADLGAIYNRQYGDKTLTFALSGYTYFDDEVWGGLDGFVFWDRETESLWWPLIGRSVSGPLKGVSLLEMDEEYWEDTDWATIKEKYPNAQVMLSGQDFERPTSWPAIDDVNQIIADYQSSSGD